jgi:quinol monooxygenase YgiN
MTNYLREIDIAAPRDVVRSLISERGDAWWTTNAVVNPAIGGACEFRFPAAGFHAAVRVMKNSTELVEWYCVSSTHPKSSGFKDLHDWVGTTIRFNLTPAGKETHVKFEHLGLGESGDSYKSKFDVWAFYLDSLKKLAETGKGDPYQGGRPGTDTHGLIAKTVAFKVKPDLIDAAKDAIRAFIDNIEANEPDTLVYRSYTDADDILAFTHHMIFKNEAAYAKHRDSTYCAAFVKVLYPCCEALPRAVALTLFREAALGSEPRQPSA